MTDVLDATAASFLGRYASAHGGGAFASPTAKELAANPGMVRDYVREQHRITLATKRLTRASVRHDFTGLGYTLPEGSLIVSHVARTEGAPLPPLGDVDYLYAYADDRELTEQLARAGWQRIAFAVSASSEMKWCWGRARRSIRYQDVDVATATLIDPGWEVPVERMAAEAAQLSMWHDDFPFYSDGSWSAINLRGFRPDDPTWGIKPSEMPKKWQAEHPEAGAYTCDWTVAAAKTPITRSFVESIYWWAGLERVRLLMMDGTAGSTLSRHTDITDKAAGTRDGQIVRFHVPLVTDPAITMSVWGMDGTRRTFHLAAGRCYYLDARKPHAVDNPTSTRRIHLVCDVVCNGEVRRRIEEGAEVE